MTWRHGCSTGFGRDTGAETNEAASQARIAELHRLFAAERQVAHEFRERRMAFIENISMPGLCCLPVIVPVAIAVGLANLPNHVRGKSHDTSGVRGQASQQES